MWEKISKLKSCTVLGRIRFTQQIFTEHSCVGWKSGQFNFMVLKLSERQKHLQYLLRAPLPKTLNGSLRLSNTYFSFCIRWFPTEPIYGIATLWIYCIEDAIQISVPDKLGVVRELAAWSEHSKQKLNPAKQMMLAFGVCISRSLDLSSLSIYNSSPIIGFVF